MQCRLEAGNHDARLPAEAGNGVEGSAAVTPDAEVGTVVPVDVERAQHGGLVGSRGPGVGFPRGNDLDRRRVLDLEKNQHGRPGAIERDVQLDFEAVIAVGEGVAFRSHRENAFTRARIEPDDRLAGWRDSEAEVAKEAQRMNPKLVDSA